MRRETEHIYKLVKKYGGVLTDDRHFMDDIDKLLETAHNSDYVEAVKNLINSEVDCVQTKNGAYVNLDGVIDCLNRALHDFA